MDLEEQYTDHISRRFNRDLEKIRLECSKMGGFVETQLTNAINALVKQDMELALKTITADQEVNAQQLHIDEKCIEILAMRQPTAGDLRLIMSITKIIGELERIGDLAKDLAKLAKRTIKKEIKTSYYIGLEPLCMSANSTLKSAMDAFGHLDAVEAFHVIEDGQNINQKFDAVFRQSLTYMMDDTHSIKELARVNNTARSLARIVDHSVNISENIVYLVKGKDIRYRKIDDIRVNILSDEE